MTSRLGAKVNRGKISIGTLFLLPSLLFVSFSILIPTVWNFILSFQKWDGYLLREWVGLRNYLAAFQDTRFLRAIFNSVYLALFSSVFSVGIGVALAAFVFKSGKIEGSIYRLFLFLPVMLPLAIIGLLFSFIYNPEMGLLNLFLGSVGLPGLQHVWLQEPGLVMSSIGVVGVWRTWGLTMMLCYTGMTMIPVSQFEASRLDGATYTQQFFRIILPQLLSVLSVSVVFTLVLSFKTFDLVYVMTGGGPGTLSETVPLLMIKTAFGFNEYGYSAAMGFVITIVVMLIIVGARRLIGSGHYES